MVAAGLLSSYASFYGFQVVAAGLLSSYASF